MPYFTFVAMAKCKGLLLLFLQTVFSAWNTNMFVNLPTGTNIALNLNTRRMFQQSLVTPAKCPSSRPAHWSKRFCFGFFFFLPLFTFFTVYQPVMMTKWHFVDQLIYCNSVDLGFTSQFYVRWMFVLTLNMNLFSFKRACCSCLPWNKAWVGWALRIGVLKLLVWLYILSSLPCWYWAEKAC